MTHAKTEPTYTPIPMPPERVVHERSTDSPNANTSEGSTGSSTPPHNPDDETGQTYKDPTATVTVGKVTYKYCAKCSGRRPLHEFPKNSDSSDGRGSYCKSCKSDLSKSRRITDAGARFTHYIVSRLKHEFPKDQLPANLETNLEDYLGYKLWQLRKKLRLELQGQGISLTKTFIDGWHLDHKRPFSSFPPHKIGDPTFKACWAIENLEMIPALKNLQKGAKVEQKPEDPSK